MLAFSTKGRYGIKAMYELALHYEDRPVSIRSISERHLIPMPYLEQILLNLKRGKLVKSTRGPRGGYVLARSPDAISLGDIIRALEGPIALCDCLSSPFDPENLRRMEGCVMALLWKELGRRIEGFLDSFKLSDLIDTFSRGEKSVAQGSAEEGKV